ncbi:hypothetical protein EUTSA_v10001709mg [Eutrema salsugineum]|uniref:Uncharacterized protein n=1 Tax=Eutrema salsugineum TaxID=72664 RepID=V4KMU8_EUTSA|nr:hypothetical protein EUTSA_v10001709mg [Eutrema salsugineum]
MVCGCSTCQNQNHHNRMLGALKGIRNYCGPQTPKAEAPQSRFWINQNHGKLKRIFTQIYKPNKGGGGGTKT